MIFDIYCENEKGEKFIVELQKSKQNWFKERTIYYSTFPIQEQVQKGDNAYNLKAVFCIGILDFTFGYIVGENREWFHTITLKNQHGVTFYDKLSYIYLEMPNFNKGEQELETRLDKWLYFIKHLEDFGSIPQIFKDEVVFMEAFEKAEISKFTKAQLDNYEYRMKGYRDLKSIIDTAEENALKRGIEKGDKIRLFKMAINCLKQGMSVENTSVLTELTIDEINDLIKNNNFK